MTISQTMGGGRPRRMGRKQRRMLMIVIAGVVLVIAVGLTLIALTGKIVFFNSPSDILATPPGPNQRIRLGGLVAVDSVETVAPGTIQFSVTDGQATIPVVYSGIVPDLFREGQGIVTEGTLGPNGTFTADTVLAKHDEAYMPAEVVQALKDDGEWYGDLPANMTETDAAAAEAAAATTTTPAAVTP